MGSLAVQVPVRQADPEEPDHTATLASFESNGSEYAIVVRGDTTSGVGEEAFRQAAHDAIRHLSRKLLN